MLGDFCYCQTLHLQIKKRHKTAYFVLEWFETVPYNLKKRNSKLNEPVIDFLLKRFLIYYIDPVYVTFAFFKETRLKAFTGL